MGSNTYVNSIWESYRTGLSDITTVKNRLQPFQQEVNPGALEATRKHLKEMIKEGSISEKQAKVLGRWSSQFTGVAGSLERAPLVGWFFKFILKILSKIPFIGSMIGKNYD